MGFVKREVVDNFVSIGDSEGDVTKVGGILTRFVANTHFAKPKTDYEYVGRDGELAVLSGSASLARQIHSEDIGKFFKAEFEGWGKSANGAFKKIAVYIWDGDPTEQMKAWPRFKDFYGKRPEPAPEPARKAAEKIRDDFDDMPEPVKQGVLDDDELDSLPF